jgi:hypothetical protein
MALSHIPRFSLEPGGRLAGPHEPGSEHENPVLHLGVQPTTSTAVKGAQLVKSVAMSIWHHTIPHRFSMALP